jgi:hypothetical protein
VGFTFKIYSPVAGVLEDAPTSFLTVRRVGRVRSVQSRVCVGECVAVAQRRFVACAEVVVWGELGCRKGGSEEVERSG